MRATIAALGLLAACERAEPPPAQPALPPSPAEDVQPKVIVEDRSYVEHPPPEPPGAAWFRHLTASEQKDVDWVCHIQHDDPCYGLIRLPSAEGAAHLRVARQYIENDSFERHCRQVAGPRRGCNTPLVISFDGAPVTFSHDVRPFSFGGTAVRTAWPTAATPWLALDRNGDGVIDTGSELFGPQARNGFDALARLDDNHDGVIDARDAAFAQLVLWADRDGDRRSTPDELTPLASVVTAIPLTSRLEPRCDDGDCEGERGTAMATDGRAAAVIDVYLRER